MRTNKLIRQRDFLNARPKAGPRSQSEVAQKARQTTEQLLEIRICAFSNPV
jgi:hypothetical protein